MLRIVVLAILATSIAAPVAAQVINGETPLDETAIDHASSGPAVRPPPPTATPDADAAEPARRDLPQTAPRRD